MSEEIRGSQGHPDPSDDARILAFRSRVRELMSDGQWHTAIEIREVGGSEGLRRFREVRQDQTWEKMHLCAGVWAYRIVPRIMQGTLF